MTNQFTDEQVEAAAKALRELDSFDEEVSSGLIDSWSRLVAVTALEAAAGAAPQSPRERTPEFESREQELFKHQPLLSMNDGGIAGCKCMDRVFYNQTEDWGTHLAEVFDTLAAPVQPSSTVDEIAEVLDRDECYDLPYGRFDRFAAARAVVEAIGGEGR